MRPRPFTTMALALAAASSAAACQLLWTYDNLTGSGGSVGSGGAPSSSMVSSTASSSGGGAPSSSSSSGFICPLDGPPGMGACTDQNDCMAIVLEQGDIQNHVRMCTLTSAPIGHPTPMCIVNMTGLSMNCAGCWAAAGACGYLYCWTVCAADANTPGCNACLATYCDCAFTKCSGIIRPAELDGGADAPCD